MDSPLSIDSIFRFFSDYFRLCDKLIGREYNRPMKKFDNIGSLHFQDHPTVKDNVYADKWNAFWYWFVTWTDDTWWRLFATGVSYDYMPYVGGLIRA